MNEKNTPFNLNEIIELAKQSEYGATYFSDKGPILITKEGNLLPITLKELPIYEPRRKKTN